MAHIKTGIDSVVHVLYHYPCPDGAFSALAAYLRFRNKVKSLVFVPHAVYTPLDVNNFPETTHAYLLDYTGKDEFPFELAKHVEKVTIIDHHKTAIEFFATKDIPNNMHVNFEMEKSGATLALSHFSKEVDLFDGISLESQERIKRIFAFIEDNDLWTFKLPNTKDFSRGLNCLQVSYDASKNHALFDQLMNLNIDELIQKGKEAEGKQNQILQAELEKSFKINLGGENSGFGQCFAIISTYSELRSSLGHLLAEKSEKDQLSAIGCVAYTVTDRPGELKVSLRSIGATDTTKISTKYGGGGHQGASSFFIPETEFEAWKVK